MRSGFIFSSQPTKGPWTVNLHPYIYRKFLEYCPERKLRWNAFQVKSYAAPISSLPSLKILNLTIFAVGKTSAV